MLQRRTLHATTPRTVRVGAALAIPAVLERLGADPAKVLAQAGVDIRVFDDPDNLIGFAERSQLIRHCVACTGCEHFGLLVGAHNGLHSLGLVGMLMKYAPDVRTALDSLVRHLHLHGRGGAVTLTTGGASAVLSYEVYAPRTVAVDQIGDGAVSFMFNLLRSLCGPDWAPTEARFAHRQPPNVAPFRRILGATLRFDAEQYALVFRAEHLKRKLGAHDPALHRLLQQQVDALEARAVDDLPGQVRTALRAALRRGPATVERVAAALSLNGRTLHRRLRGFGTGFQRLLDEVRFEFAQELLESSSLDVHEIGLRLDYADASTFSRAFRRWSGTTPARWRAISRAAG